MLGVIVKATIKPNANAAFEAAAGKFAKAVRVNEPGNHLFAIHRTDDPAVYIFLERYENEAAIEAHRESSHYKELRPTLDRFFAAPLEIKRMREVEI